jgi:hypothetical protein
MKKLWLLFCPCLLALMLATGCSNNMRVTGVVRCTGNNEWVIDTGTCLYSIDSSLGNAYNEKQITVTGRIDGDTEYGPFIDIHDINNVQ